MHDYLLENMWEEELKGAPHSEFGAPEQRPHCIARVERATEMRWLITYRIYRAFICDGGL